MKLKPSARIKKRYILFSTNSKEEIEKIILDYLGILGWARASPIFMYIPVNYTARKQECTDRDSQTKSTIIGNLCIRDREKRLVLSVDRKELDNVRAAFELANSDIKIIKISGTLKGLKKTG